MLSGYASSPNRCYLGTFEGQGDPFTSSRLAFCVANNLALVIDLLGSRNPAGCAAALSLPSSSGSRARERPGEPGEAQRVKRTRCEIGEARECGGGWEGPDSLDRPCAEDGGC